MLHDVLSRRWLQDVSRARLKLTLLIMMHKRSAFAELLLIRKSDPFKNTVPSVEYHVCFRHFLFLTIYHGLIFEIGFPDSSQDVMLDDVS